MKTMLMIGAMAFVTVATTHSALAKAYEFTFYSNSGGAYCDGIQFTFAQGLAIGEHIYDGTYCPNPPVPVGGLESHVRAVGPGDWFLFTQVTPGNAPGYLFLTFVDVKALTWKLYSESSEYGIPLTLINDGVLIKGPPPQHANHKTLGSVIRVGLARRGQ